MFKSSRSWWWVCSISVLCFSVAMIGCKEPKSFSSLSAASTAKTDSAERKTADQKLATTGQTEKANCVGSWELDAAMSVDQTVDANEGKVNLIVDLKQVVQQSFNEMEMSIEVSEDGTFACKQKTPFEEAVFRGNWTVEADQVTFLQTHREDVVEEDRLAGKIIGGRMELDHVQGEFTARYVLFRKE